jgi:hypothetical protein
MFASLRFALATALLAAPPAAWGDVVYLKSGGKLEGRIVSRTETKIEVDIGAGSLSLPMASVERVEEARSPLDDYDERAAAVGASDLEGWLELARWASRASLGTQSLDAYEHVLELDSGNAEANRALGRVEVDGRWLSEEEAYRARGYIHFEGRWMTPEEQAAIERERAADRAAQAQAQTAEALARAAEARAQAAQAEAQESAYENPLYWGAWGPGPVVWPRPPAPRPPRPQPRGW